MNKKREFIKKNTLPSNQASLNLREVARYTKELLEYCEQCDDRRCWSMVMLTPYEYNLLKTPQEMDSAQ